MPFRGVKIIKTKSKFAILSHDLPPSQSGQALVLYSLLKKLPSKDYCLISSHKEENQEVVNRLEANYYRLQEGFNFARPNNPKLVLFKQITNSGLTILSRTRQIMKIVKKEECKVLIACSGDPFNIPAAYLASKLLGIKLICYMFDDYLYQWTGVERKFIQKLEPIIIKGSEANIVPNEFLQKDYLLRYGIKSHIVRNPCTIPDYSKLDHKPNYFDKKVTNIVFTGTIYHAHYDAFRNLINAIKNIKGNIRLHLFTGRPQDILMAEGIKGDFVIYHGLIKQSEVDTVLRQADLLFLPLAFHSAIPEVIRTSAPGKMGEYLAVGKPILVHSPEDSFISWYFKQNGCGLVVDKSDPELLKKAILTLLSDEPLQNELGHKARIQAEVDFDVQKVRLEFQKIIS